MFLESKDFSLFAGLQPEEKQFLLKAGVVRSVKAQQVFVHQGSPVVHFYLLLEGTAQIFRTSADGQEKTLHILKAGHTMGEAEIMDRCRSHRTNVKAVEQLKLLEFPAQWLTDSARQYPEFALNLLSLLSQETQMAELEAEQQASMNAPQLVACFLQRLCVLYDYNPKQFTLPYSKSLIASRLGMEGETFSRALAKLRDHGIQVKGNQVSIENLDKIESFVCSVCSIAGDCNTHQSLGTKLGHQ